MQFYLYFTATLSCWGSASVIIFLVFSFMKVHVLSNQIFPSASSAVGRKGLINYFPQAQFSNKKPFLPFNFLRNLISSFPFSGVDFFKNEKKKKTKTKINKQTKNTQKNPKNSKRKLQHFFLHREFTSCESNTLIYLKIGFSSQR